MNHLPIKQKNNIFIKIRSFFRKLFCKNVKLQASTESEIKDIENKNISNNFRENLEIEVENTYLQKSKKEEFLQKVEENPNLLYELSNDRLKKLEKYYDELIEKDKLKLKKLKSNLQST